MSRVKLRNMRLLLLLSMTLCAFAMDQSDSAPDDDYPPVDMTREDGFYWVSRISIFSSYRSDIFFHRVG